jgi:hypothetical protein
MAMLGGVSITGIVLVIGFLSTRSIDPASTEVNTLAVMFALAFGFFLQTAYTLSYLPDRSTVGEPLFRLYYSFASTLQFRTVLLLVFTLTNFVELFGLTLTGAVLDIFTPISVTGTFLVIVVVADSLGLIKFEECYLSAAAGLLLGGLFYVAVHAIPPDISHTQVTTALLFAGVNGSSYVVAGLVPLAPRRPVLHSWLTRNARLLAAIDMQITIISLLVLWLVVARLV